MQPEELLRKFLSECFWINDKDDEGNKGLEWSFREGYSTGSVFDYNNELMKYYVESCN